MAKSGKRKREEIEEEEEVEEEEEEGFTVEVITHARVADTDAVGDDAWEYYVKWGGYGSEDDSWEPAANVAACGRLLEEFWRDVGTDDGDYPVGTVLTASEKFIKRERKRYRTEYAGKKDEAKKQKERAERKKEEEFAAKKAAKKKKQSLDKKKSKKSPSKAGEDKKTKVKKTDLKGKHKKITSASTSSAKFKNFDSSNKEKKSDPPSQAPSPPASKSKDLESTGKKSAPPSRAPSPPKSNKAVESLFSPSPSPATSPEISLSELNPKPTPKPKPTPTPKLPAKVASTSSNPSKGRPNISIDTEMPAASPTLPSATFKPPPPPLPKPQTSAGPAPLPRRTVSASSNPGSASSSTFPSRPFGKTATPTIPPATSTLLPAGNPSTLKIASAKPATPTISSAKPATPTLPFVSKPSSTPTFPSALPAHLQRRGSASSRAPLPVPPPTSSGSGLSTKQRLAQGALDLAPTNTKETTRKSNLAGLSFKKSSLAGSAPASGSPSRARNVPPPPPKPSRPTIDPLFDDPDDEPFNMVDSPVSPHHEAEEQTILPPALSRRRSQPNLNAQADDFLSNIIPQKPAAPLMATVDKEDAVPNPPRPMGSLGVKPKIYPPRIPKKWKWTGKLLMDVTDKTDGGPRTDHFCDVVLTDLYPASVNGPQIDVAMVSVESLHLLNFHDHVDMGEFLKTSGAVMNSPEPLHQLARVAPSTDKDLERLKILARYMTKKNFVSLVPIFLEGNLGHLLLFPPVKSILVRIFQAPDDLVNSNGLIAALLPWKLDPNESRRSFLPSGPKAPIPSSEDWKKNMAKSKYQLALRILKFPASLHEWMSKSGRPYCIWPPSEDRRGNRDRETGYLTSILKECGAKKVGFKSDPRAIFVHVGALKSISKMPFLVQRRRQTCSIYFYTYGTHESVHPEYWGLREIYPLGGVVTFTPSALYEDPWGVINRMKVINKHPLWTCYILPSVLGLATKLCSPDEDPLAAFDRGVYVFILLLKAIENGEISLLRAPPLDRNPTPTSDEATHWLRDHWINRPLGSRNLLKYCIDVFTLKYSNIPPAECASAIEAEISQDLDSMQRQPDIMKHYRRFVVIRAESDNHIEADKDGFEWLTSSSFSLDHESDKVAGTS
ncbi:hypothetical protein B0H19DRAFT_1254435 [Mycena capillaripes]|nr:hypothetical protein B0H19DRAFT_1254435 [Mycena capillaripes]